MVTADVIMDKIAQSVGIVAGNAVEYAMLLVYAVIVLAIGWVVGALVEKIVVRVLKRPEIETGLVNYGAATGKLWNSVTGFLGKFVFAWVLIAIFAAVFRGPVVNDVFNAVSDLFVFSILVLFGVLAGGIMYKLAKDILAGAGFDASLTKHGMSETVGNIHISSAIAGVVKLYVILMFLQQATDRVGTNVIKNTIDGLMSYIPSAILGAAVLLVAVVLADFVAVLVKKKNYPFADTITVVAEGVIVFFGIVLALPKFGIEDVTILTYSFLIVISGLSLGLAMAIGLGLKDSVNTIAVGTRRGRKKKEEV